jgi:NADPH-dependent glutamate synthase beta subunit-like oxidoreductase
VGFKKGGDGLVNAMVAIRMELGEPDASGRRRPVPIGGSEFEIPASAVISAVSQQPDFSGFEDLIEGRDWIKVDERGHTRADKVWAGGDVTNLALVTDAVGQGRRAAESIVCAFLGTEPDRDPRGVIHSDRMLLDHYKPMERNEPTTLDVGQRMADLNTEVNLGFTLDQTMAESARCMSCGMCFDCEKCWMYCQDSAIEKPMKKGDLYPFRLQNCTGCAKCAQICPCGFIEMA